LASYPRCPKDSSRIKEREKMYSTKFVKAQSSSDAAQAVSSASEGKILAGGMTLIPTLKQRLANPDCLIDISGCGFDSIEDQGKTVKIGSMAKHVSVAESRSVSEAIPSLAALAVGIGDRQVRNRGTIGGSVANNDPAACYPSAVMALDGTVHTNKRDITSDDFFKGMFETALEEDEVIEAVSFKKPEKACYMKFPNPASRYAMVGVFVAKFSDGVRVAVTGAGEDGVFRHAGLEEALSSNFSEESVSSVDISADGLMSDIHASADYRASLIGEMTRRAVAS
jgi:carbon-monoxide dehydrogenase medium subunit